MDEILTEVPSEDFEKFEEIYYAHLREKEMTPKIQFEYAWCLVSSKSPTDIKKGVLLLEELYKTHEKGQRDYLYYLALGNAKMKEYNTALKYVEAFLSVEPENQQVMHLEALIKKRMQKEGLIGMGIATGVVAAMGGLIAVGISLAKNKKTPDKDKEKDVYE